MKIVSVAQMRALETAAFASGISEAELQQQAAHAVGREVLGLAAADQRVAILVGHGNNGRDGALAGAWLQRQQRAVDLILAPRHTVTPEELTRFQAGGGSVINSANSVEVENALVAATVGVDALAGIGARGALREPLASLAAVLNRVKRQRRGALKVIAVDIPSGIDADTGQVTGEAVWADLTVTLGAVKQGLLRFPAAARVGRLLPREIGIPPSASAQADLPYRVLTDRELAELVPERPLDAHKYRFGRVLVLAGSDHFPGAAVLCTTAAARVGAGLVTLGASRDVRLAVAAHRPEVTYTQTDIRPTDGASAAEALKAYLGSHSCMVLGPGLGRSAATTAFVHQLLTLREHSAVIDADGLVALSEIEHWPALLGANVVLTPHSGELERLVGHELSSDEPLWVHAGRLAQRWQCVLIAKGPFTCVANPDGRVDVWPRANPALATGGTGDVLAGISGGLLAQGMTAWDAARLAVGLHATAAERILLTRDWHTLLASDLLSELPAALAELTRHR